MQEQDQRRDLLPGQAALESLHLRVTHTRGDDAVQLGVRHAPHVSVVQLRRVGCALALIAVALHAVVREQL